ncbi:28S ribosomal protein S9, mitochondrial [Clupea harengus]|uniref:Small ribosomal subunit protein uS9m n=1 Tax=Clupea harengus TaxID=7950 RepID=A0A6P3VQN5_CLUHA|nr:28S ribosomal protein S9, mitochondrial [Clupea harengus]
MAAARGTVVGSLLLKYGNRFAGSHIVTTAVGRQPVSRQICTSCCLLRKNLAAAGPEKFTEEFIKQQVEEFNIGKRHLANMMGEDPETFTQQDIDRSIKYLFPSGLFEKKARPVMKHPDEVFPKQTAIQWGQDGRPFHFLFYTGKQSYYSLMHDVYGKMLAVEKHQDRLRNKGLFSQDTNQIALVGSRWLRKEELEELLVENISDNDYARFIQLMERLLSMPYSALEEECVQRYRRQLEVQSSKQEIPPLQHDQQGAAFSTAVGRRKTATASVVCRDGGSGKMTINGKDHLQCFPVLQDREQLVFPLHFVNMLGRFDVDASVSGGGHSAQSGALRLALSRALLTFLPDDKVEHVRQAGLLTSDPRVKERKKPGQAKARKKFTWKKR